MIDSNKARPEAADRAAGPEAAEPEEEAAKLDAATAATAAQDRATGGIVAEKRTGNTELLEG